MRHLLPLLAVCSLACLSHAQTVSLTATADTLLSSAHPTSNYGGAGALAVSASGLPKGEFDSLLMFDFAAVKSTFDPIYGVGGWTLASATLTLTATPPNNALFNGNGTGPGGTNVNTAGSIAFRWVQNDAWTEGTGTPSAPTTDGITFAGLPGLLGAADESLGSQPFNGATTGGADYPLALTTAFVADATAGQIVSLLALPGDSAVSAVVNSRTVGTATSRPTLKITAVPEPGSASLALAGLLVVAARRGRSRCGGESN